MKMFSIWKLLRKIQLIQMRRSVYLLDASNYLNMEHSPSGHLSDTGQEPGIPSRLNSPFTCIVQHYVRSTLVLLFAMSCLVMYLCALYLLFLPPLLSGRPRDWCCPCDRLRRRRSFFPFSGASRQALPLIIRISPIPFSLMLELDFATVIVCSYSDE